MTSQPQDSAEDELLVKLGSQVCCLKPLRQGGVSDDINAYWKEVETIQGRSENHG